MNINLTERQFELLYLLVYMGRFCHGIVQRPETMTAEEGELLHLVNKLSFIAKETKGLEHLVSDFPDGKLRPSLFVEHKTIDILNKANSELLAEMLAGNLASDEIKRVYGDLPKNTKEEYANWSRLYEAAYEYIYEDIKKNEMANIRLVKPDQE